jgi:DNA polymerase-1
MPALEFMVDLEVNGLLYDQDLNRKMDVDMRRAVSELEEKIYPAIGETPDTINLESGADLSRLLYRKNGFTPTVFTKKNQPAVSGDALKAIQKAGGPEWLKWLADRNDISSTHSSFIATYVDDWVKRDGRIHPNYNLHGTSSHRISSDKPNLLNIPKPLHGFNIRDLYIVDKGYAFLTFDFSSCEVKVLAAMCKDENMLKAILSGLDFHSYTASLMYGIPYEELVGVLKEETHPKYDQYKTYRQNAKAVTFGILYGSSVGGVAATIGTTPAEAQKIIDAYFDVYPRIRVFVEDSHKMAIENHWVYSPFGQRKMEFGTYPCYKGTAVYNAALRNSQNVRIQGPASTLGLMAFSKMNDAIKKIGGKTICTVYDSVELQVPIDRVAEAIEIGFYCMDDWPQEAFSWLDFPIGADAEIGFSWGKIRKIHRGVSQEKVNSMLRELS